MSLITSFRSEIFKIRRTAAFYFTIVGAAIVPALYLLNAATGDIEDTKKDPFNAIFKLASEMNALVFFPWFIVLICTLMPQIEYKNNTWKQVLTSPQSRWNIFFAKFFSIHFLLLLFIVANHLLMFVAATFVHFIMPELDLLNQPLNGYKILVNAVNTYVTVLAICSIQFWLGLRFRNFIVPVAIGLTLWLTGTLLVFEYHWAHAKYFPYAFQIFSSSPNLRSQINQVEWISLGYSVVFLTLGYIDFSRRRITA